MSIQPLTYWVYFFQFNLLFGSFWLMLKSLHGGKRAWIFNASSLLLSAFNLALTEYLYFLELLRIPILFFYNRGDGNEGLRNKAFIWKKYWPYLLVFVAISVIRLFNQSQLSGYYRVNTKELLANPFQTLLYFMSRVLTDIPKNGLTGWVQPILDAHLSEWQQFPSSQVHIL